MEGAVSPLFRGEINRGRETRERQNHASEGRDRVECWRGDITWWRSWRVQSAKARTEVLKKEREKAARGRRGEDRWKRRSGSKPSPERVERV